MLKVNFPSIGEYDYDSNDRASYMTPDSEIDRKQHEDEFWAKYDPFETYDHFTPVDDYESYDKWQDECLKEALGDPMLYTGLTGINPPTPNTPPPKTESDKPEEKRDHATTARDFMEGRFRVMFHPVSPSSLLDYFNALNMVIITLLFVFNVSMHMVNYSH